MISPSVKKLLTLTGLGSLATVTGCGVVMSGDEGIKMENKEMLMQEECGEDIGKVGRGDDLNSKNNKEKNRKEYLSCAEKYYPTPSYSDE